MMDDYEMYEEEEIQQQQFYDKVMRIKAEADAANWNNVLNTVEGRYVIDFILSEFSKPFNASFDPESERHTCFREGERNVGNKILNYIMSNNMEHWYTMEREANARATRIVKEAQDV